MGSPLTGVGRYALNLLLGLSYIESTLELLVLFSDARVHKVVSRSGGPYRNRFQWIPSATGKLGSAFGNRLTSVELPWLLRVHNAKLFHNLATQSVWTTNIPFLSTVHELEGLHFGSAETYRKKMKRILKKAALMIAVSKTVASEIENELHFSMPKIRIIPHAIDPWFAEKPSQEEVKAMRNRFQLRGPYFLCVSSSPRESKNVDFITKFAEADSRNWVFTIKRQSHRSKPTESKVYYLNNLDDIWLRPLYAEATAVVMPSIYEGFSIPPMEALAAGTIPVVSDIAAHKEILGNVLPKQLFFDPKNSDSLNSALSAVTQGGEPLKTAILDSFKMIKDKYSYIETAKKVQTVYIEALNL